MFEISRMKHTEILHCKYQIILPDDGVWTCLVIICATQEVSYQATTQHKHGHLLISFQIIFLRHGSLIHPR